MTSSSRSEKNDGRESGGGEREGDQLIFLKNK